MRYRAAARIGAACALSLAIAIAGVQLVLLAEAASAVECTAAGLQAKAPRGTTITGASKVPATGNVPEYCRVDGNVATPGNTVNFRLGLPSTWNGKYYFAGVGGLGGRIGSLDAGLARGYASASTDTGHVADDPAWESSMAAKIDYGHRGTHVTAVAGKALTKTYYGRAADHAYFNGCSNGGRQAMMEVQRYPGDFDGVIAGHPATGTPMQVGRVLVFQQQLLHPERYVPREKVELLSNATLAACDASDGLVDNLVSDPRKCAFRPETLKCAGGDAPDCLTQPQIDSVNQIYSAIKTPDGNVYTQGLPVGHEGGATGWQAWITGRTPPTLQTDGTLGFGDEQPSGYRLSDSNMRFLALERSDPAFNWRTFRFPQDLPRLKKMTAVLSPLDPDLRPFKRRGGKLIVYHGWADPAISAYGTIDYYERMTKAVGGTREADAFARLYLVPGMHHCGGGPGPNSFDMLPVLEAWVEQGVPPAAVLASRVVSGKVDRTRPLCPYPQVAQYTGSGSIDDAANFRCVADQ